MVHVLNGCYKNIIYYKLLLILRMQLQVTSTFLIFSLFLTVDPPKITRHPESQSVVTGSPIAFTVEATGDELQFLWQKDGKEIDKNESRLQCSQTDHTSTLHIQHVKKSNKGHYRCLLKNPIEKSGIKSDVAKLIVREFFVCCLLLFFFVFLLSFSLCSADHRILIPLW